MPLNLRAIANAAIQGINPDIVGTVKRSAGYVTDADYLQVPQYTTFTGIRIQQQAVSGIGTDGPSLQHLDAMGIQGTLRSFWADMDIEAVNRTTTPPKGGDLIVLPSTPLEAATTWLVVQIVEQWTQGGWCHFIGQLQRP